MQVSLPAGITESNFEGFSGRITEEISGGINAGIFNEEMKKFPLNLWTNS